MTDPLGKKWTNEYDTRGRLAKITYPDVTPTTCTFSYDEASNVTGRQFTGGPNLLCTYDNLGRLDTADGLDFSYDAEGNLTNAAQNGQNFAATYDDGGRLTSVSYLNNSITVNYQYDSRNRLDPGHRLLISIDDFGTGFSSLNYLRRFSISGLKIDQSFGRDLGSGSAGGLVQAILGIARSFDLGAIAEGIETSAQAEALTALGCDLMQGFLFCRPLPAAALIDYLAVPPAIA